MRKIMYLLAVIGLVSLAACEKNPDGPNPKDSITNIEVPTTAEIGKSVTVRGEGFDEAVAKLFFVDAKNVETAIESPKFTSMGVSFVVPKTLTPGIYTLLCDQNGKIELGKIELKEAKVEITSLKVPTYTGNGKTLHIEGIGFPENSEIQLEGTDAKRVKLTITDRANGLLMSIPADFVPGNYKVILVSGTQEVILAEKLTVYLVKEMKSLSFNLDMMGMINQEATWAITKSGEELTGVQCIMGMKMVEQDPNTGEPILDENGNPIMQEMTAATNYSVKKDGQTYTCTPDMEDESNFPFSLTLAEGRVISSTEILLNNTYDWTYTPEGFIEKSVGKFTYENGLLVNYNGTKFNYNKATQIENPYTPDVVKALLCTKEFSNYQIIASMAGWDGKTNHTYPDVYISAESGMDTECKITYTFDKDNYVESMSWTDEMASMAFTLKFAYL